MTAWHLMCSLRKHEHDEILSAILFRVISYIMQLLPQFNFRLMAWPHHDEYILKYMGIIDETRLLLEVGKLTSLCFLFLFIFYLGLSIQIFFFFSQFFLIFSLLKHHQFTVILCSIRERAIDQTVEVNGLYTAMCIVMYFSLV